MLAAGSVDRQNCALLQEYDFTVRAIFVLSPESLLEYLYDVIYFLSLVYFGISDSEFL